jgi:hypothetical protein
MGCMSRANCGSAARAGKAPSAATYQESEILHLAQILRKHQNLALSIFFEFKWIT